MNINYPKTLEKCEEVKLKLEELSNILYYNVSQELSISYENKKNDIVNWIEEIEFEITNYEQN